MFFIICIESIVVVVVEVVVDISKGKENYFYFGSFFV